MGPYERRSGAMSVEQRGPAVCSFSGRQEGKDEMTKASMNLQDLRRRIYVKAKAETTWRFWGMYVHVCKMETLREAYALAQNNDGAPGSDGVTFAVIEAHGVEGFSNGYGTNCFSTPICRSRLGGRRYQRTGARSASFRFLRSEIEWCKVRSSSCWSQFSRQTSNRDRLDIVPSGQLMKRSTGDPERLVSTRHAS